MSTRRWGNRGDVTLLIAIGAALVVVVAFTASRFLLSSRVKQEALVLDSIESFGTNEIAAWNIYYKKLADASLAEGKQALSLDNAMDLNISALATQNVVPSTADNVPLNIKTTLEFDSEKTVIRRLANQDLNSRLETKGDAVNYCGEIKSKGGKRGFSACLSIPQPTTCGVVNECGGIELCPGNLGTTSGIAVSTKEDFMAMKSNKRYRLTNHIDFGNGGFTPIADLHDVYIDGNGFEVRNINVTGALPGAGDWGLIQVLGAAVVKNLTLKNIYIDILNSNYNLGTLAGVAEKSLCIKNVKLEGVTLKTSGSFTATKNVSVGGLIARVKPDIDKAASVIKDYVVEDQSVSTTPNVVFRPQKVSIEDSSANVTLRDLRLYCVLNEPGGVNDYLDSRSVGGLIGSVGISGDLKIQRTTLTGTVNGLFFVGGAIGLLLPAGPTLLEDVNATNLTVEATSVSCLPSNVFFGLPAGGFIGAITSVASPIPLTLATTTIRSSSNLSTTVRGGFWVGGLVGSGYPYARLVIENSRTSGSVYSVKPPPPAGSSQSTMSRAWGVGGLIGSGSGEILNSSSSANVIGEQDVGGLVGYFSGIRPTPATWMSRIEKSFSTGNVSLTDAGGPGGVVWVPTKGMHGIVSDAGGLVGRFRSYGSGPLTGLMGQIVKSYASGTVTSTVTPVVDNGIARGGSHRLGGLIGWLDQSIGVLRVENSYATGNISGSNSLGSLFGQATYSKTAGVQALQLENLYATGKSQLNYTYTDRGPIIGTYDSGAGSMKGVIDAKNIYYDSQKTGLSSSQVGTAMNTSQMASQNSFSGFDFNTVWKSPVSPNPPTLR